MPALARSLLVGALGIAASGCDTCNRSQVVVSDAAPQPTTVLDAATINATPVPTASVERLLNPGKLPAYAGPTGSIEGTISVVGAPAPATEGDFHMCPEAERTFGHAFREGPPTEKGSRWLADAVVAVTGYQGFYVPEKEEAEELTIKGCSFDRRTVTMTFGQRLDVKNLSREFWTPMLEPSPNKVMMMATPGGDPVKIYPKRPGRFRLIDHDRKYAVADVFAFLHPLHTTSALEGTYRIDGVPVGKLTVNTSHPRIPGAEASAEVDVKQGVVHRVDLTLEYKPAGQDAGAASDASTGVPGLH